MIKATELRLFNTVSWEGSIDTVVSIEYNYPDCSIKLSDKHGGVAWVNEKDIDFIPLTPEWLERCGFEYHMPYYIFNAFIISENRYRDGSGNYDGFHMTIRIEDRIMPMVIRSVHQLQNLYFALTGEELTINNEHLQTTS